MRFPGVELIKFPSNRRKISCVAKIRSSGKDFRLRHFLFQGIHQRRRPDSAKSVAWTACTNGSIGNASNERRFPFIRRRNGRSNLRQEQTFLLFIQKFDRFSSTGIPRKTRQLVSGNYFRVTRFTNEQKYFCIFHTQICLLKYIIKTINNWLKVLHANIINTNCKNWQDFFDQESFEFLLLLAK